MVPKSGEIDDLVAAVGADRGRRIVLLPVETAAGSPSGMWIATDRSDYVVFPNDASAAERDAIVCHELAHMLLGHQSIPGADRLGDLAALLAPSIDAATARRLLARHSYAEGIEAEAEELGTALMTQLARQAAAGEIRRDAVSDRLR